MATHRLRLAMRALILAGVIGCSLDPTVTERDPLKPVAAPALNPSSDKAPGSGSMSQREAIEDDLLAFTDISFEFDKADVKPEANVILDRLVAYLKNHPSQQVTIEGYADSVGASEYNIDLSRRRANAVREKLIQNGIAPARITTRGLGEASPITSNQTASGRQRNRRVEIVLDEAKN